MTGTPRATHPARPPTLVPRSPEDALASAFIDWLEGDEKPAELHLDGPDGPPTRLTWLLGVLSTSASPLPPEAARTLGLDDGATIGTAATELLVAVKDPAGPNCRSYRAAAYYLRSHHELEVIFDEL